ncbi:MAG: cation diffusion facilitator family transporter [Treponemataceae bacterium]|nr:cation diffusion facilitator family transporter [Treponemataceae bacterium]
MEKNDKNYISEYQISLANRNRKIIKTSLIGIIANVFLAGFKAAVGLLSNSISVLLDAVNNLSDALSSLITIIGAKLAAKLPTKKHPLGYGRIEYISGMIVSAIVIYAGITAAIESVKKIIKPETAEYSVISLVIIGVAVLVKILLGLYVKRQGKKVESTALLASGNDALFDSIISFSVLVSALIYLFTGFSLEAYVGIVISVFIIKAGIEMMLETLDDILGKRADPETIRTIKSIVTSEEGVRGAYDVILNNYGPGKNYASLHIELPDCMTVDQVDVLTRKIEEKVYLQTGIIIAGIGVYSYNTKDNLSSEMRNKINKRLLENEWALQMHGFYVDMEKKTMRFDVVLAFGIKPSQAVKIMTEQVKELYPDFTAFIAPDVDISG